MKKIIFILSLFLLSNISYAASCAGYRDVRTSDWYCPTITKLQEDGILSKQDFFRPSDKINRAEAIALSYKIIGTSFIDYKYDFFDITGDIWYKKYFYDAYAKKYISPENYKILASNSVTKSEFIVLLMQILNISPENTNCVLGKTKNQNPTSNFVISDNYKKYLCQAQNLNIVDKDFDQNFLDRATMSKIVYNMIYIK